MTPAETIKSAFARHQSGDLDAAEALYRAALRDDAGELNGLQLLGLLLHERGRTVEAVALLQSAVAVLERRGNAAGPHAALYNNLGNALRAAGRLREAAVQYRRGLALDPGVTDLHANLGTTLMILGDHDGSAASFETALKFSPDHAGALLGLATALIDRGSPAEALALCWRLMAKGPDSPDVHFARGRALRALGDERGAIEALQRCLELDPCHAEAPYALGAALIKVGMAKLAVPFLERAVAVRPGHVDAHAELGNVLHELGETARALDCFRRTCALRPLISWPAARRPAEFSILVIASPGVANTPPHFLFANAPCDRHFFALLPDVAPNLDLLRRHGDIVFNLISDVDQGGDMLTAAANVIDGLGRPTINHPRRISGTDRETIATRLSGIAGCTVPRTVRVTRAELAAAHAADALARRAVAFPLLLRVAGTHGGDAFEKIDAAEGLAPFLAAHAAADAFYVTAYIDYQSQDGHFRKYRFVLTDQEVLPYHLAIGDQWKVHHYSTAMDRHVWMQEEEKAFLENPGGVFSPAHHAAMAAIRDAVGLDFLGIDCSLDHDGNLLIFEVNASILIHDDNADFPYKTPFCLRIRQAFEAMLARAAARAREAAASAPDGQESLSHRWPPGLALWPPRAPGGSSGQTALWLSAGEGGEPVMPQYHFHITNGPETLPDTQALDLPGPAAAREQAVLLARGLKAGEADGDWDGWFVDVKDENGRSVETVPIPDVEE